MSINVRQPQGLGIGHQVSIALSGNISP